MIKQWQFTHQTINDVNLIFNLNKIQPFLPQNSVTSSVGQFWLLHIQLVMIYLMKSLVRNAMNAFNQYKPLNAAHEF